MELVLKKDSIVNQKVDVIVNSTPPNLNLSDGVVSRAILERAGDAIQQECNDQYQSGIKSGEIAETTGGSLSCQTIYHLTLPDWSDQGDMKLEEVITTCLEKADADGHSSIAFPVLGVGKLKYPPDAVAKIFFETVIGFAERSPGSLQKVVVAIFNSNDAIKAFDNERKNHLFETRIQINARLDQTILSNSARMRFQPLSLGQTKGAKRPKVSYVVGNIANQNADVLVNSTIPSLDLTSGPVTKAILAAAGPGIQQECQTNYPNGIKSWEVAVTSGGQLKCKQIYHTTLVKSEWSDIKQNYEGLIKRLLDTAESASLESIAFPVLGAGVLKYPPDEVAKCMFETALAFRGIHLKTIIFAIHPKDESIQTAFKTELRRRIDLNRSVKPAGQGAAFSISLVKDDIAQQRVDVIVNSTTPNLNLLSGPVTKAIVKVAGDSIQQECKDKYPNGIKAGEIAVTGGGNLHCRFVYHTTLDKWSPDEKTVTALRNLIANCLSQAAKDGLASIAFPVMGTGVLKYPRDVVSNVIFESFDSFSKNHPNTSLQVKVVIHPNDVENWRVFTHTEQPSDSRESQGAAGPEESFEGQFQQIPQEWSLMGKTDFYKLVQVLPGTTEYQTVEQNFSSSLQQAVTIVKIERIQNKTLYYQYFAMKNRYEVQNQGIQNERILWHGTSSDVITCINTYGFNRSYCGKNATMYGQGVYFATNASYSASERYSVPDNDGCKYIYQTKVLTGEFTAGDSSLKVPPVKPNSESHIKYDSVVDDPNNPSIFVIFHDTQAYPQYLITFK
ncbi:protein mono-ADP-ribosyltransferase PARP15-like [Gigantopelta aegis]|uniref:protein mono-ADP-ribosyltransferase PARP15-like n=1 Tax=Gigantopelta aegis TaxID=1735272 RepID=UPI001B8898F1|nr:protein mono-ADP-ribosyltransferase PARP15-like [Gigantopelta aegis]